MVGCAGDDNPPPQAIPDDGLDGLSQIDDDDDDDGRDGTGDRMSCEDPSVASGNISLEVDALEQFCAENNAVEGDLTLSGAGAVDLSVLSCLCSVGGELSIFDSDLVTLDGLDRLETVGSLSIVDNRQLSDIQALGSLTDIPGEAVVSGSPDLLNLLGLHGVTATGGLTLDGLGIASLRGLDSLVTVAGDLTLRDLPALTDMSGASSLDFVDGTFLVEDTPDHDFTGLESIRRIRSALVVRDSGASLVGLDNLGTIGGSLFLDGVPRISSLDGLSGLAEIGGHLRIYDAPSLNSLSGPSNLRNITGSLWLLRTNVASISGLTGLIAVGGLHLDTNPYLTSTAGLPPVIELSELVLHWNADLVELTHLDTVRTVAGPLTISGHAALDQVGPLFGIQFVEGDVTIVNNVALSAEDAQALVDEIGSENITGAVDVEGNSG
jgi:hypothetical protein